MTLQQIKAREQVAHFSFADVNKCFIAMGFHHVTSIYGGIQSEAGIHIYAKNRSRILAIRNGSDGIWSFYHESGKAFLDRMIGVKSELEKLT